MTTAFLPEWPVSPLGEPGAESVDELLWRDPDLSRFPHRAAEHVLTAIDAVLGRRRPLGGAEQGFLDAHGRFRAAAVDRPDAFARVWTDPAAYAWTRIAHALLGAVLDDRPVTGSAAAYCDAIDVPDVADALRQHLDGFRAFELGLASAAGCGIAFETPLRVGTPFAVPGTRWTVTGGSSVAIHGVDDQGLDVTSAACALHVCPVARANGHSWRVQPEALHLPGWELVEPALRAGPDYQTRHVALVEEALGRVARHAPGLFDHFARAIQVIALKPRDWGGFDDFSNPELPGSFVASVVENPVVLADHFVHELQHNRLGFLEEGGALLRDGPPGAGFYSPWRDNARSLYGVYHGVYVFLGVYRYWRGVHTSGDDAPETAAYARDRVHRLPRQLRLAVRVLRTHGDLAPLGERLLDELERDVDAVGREAAADGYSGDAPAFVALDDGSCVPERSRVDGRPMTVRQAVAEHVRLHEAGAQCDGLLADVA